MTSLPVPAEGVITRQRQRAVLRRLSGAVLKRLVNIPRRVRRLGARSYANQAYRDMHTLPLPGVHRYRKVQLNQSVREWVREHGNA